ncbi:MAG: bifunctional 5,10-methylenetetrahydrofolate dehydrogenase/5,10-methenyltetrahydrofolate cyclohydrolase [Verrucomicrobia bacterium]|nr:bifunctional 5,10-methylenetetrahydrofolate dehydrogenase/5,10-methenyltetrahydrofolate cyclohydrolase [Verrucomicrobiota bacterium]
MAHLIDGRAIAAGVHAETAARVAALRARGIRPGLMFIRVGEDPASQVYVGMKEKKAAELGFHSETRVLPAATPEADLLDLVARVNADPQWHGLLIQAPLPTAMHAPRVYAAVSPAKDVDGFHPVNVGKLSLGDPSGFAPCTPAGIQELLVRTGVPLEGAEVVVLGRGNIVGKPMASLLVQKSCHANCTVTLCHSGTRDVAAHCRRADILIAAMGVPEFVRGSMVRPGAVVVDVGVNRIADPAARGGSRLVGDVAFEEVSAVAGHLTPNPGGVGPMTIAMLLANTARAAEQSAV